MVMIQNIHFSIQNTENVDMVLGIKNVFELGGVMYSQESCFSFLNRPIPLFLRVDQKCKSW